MATTPASNHAFWTTRNGILLAVAILSSAAVWWVIAWPVASLANVAAHQGHFALTFAHMLGGTGMLAFGAANLYLAARKTRFALHRRIGQIYLATGAFGATTAIAVTLSAAHKTGPILTNSTLSLATLGSAWLAFAALGWRAGRNRRFASHGDWMIRSYVLSWAFVLCRFASPVPEIGQLGNGQAFIWLSWVLPMMMCEVVLQWPQRARKS
ncbi:DUF2306 domain-containing protein [Sandarakinorhabdus sp.]|uniref:DUF2306 domain-containing protein n=1 Tax=Sandarakinorhabdus sp. TaxID=1916663 RepID=UPI00286D9F74|nr:DUF2306 domain-containing protein [Sandarakinorhabdus sp.]